MLFPADPALPLETAPPTLAAPSGDLHAAELEMGGSERAPSAELRIKVEALARANGELETLIDATDMATLFLDLESRLRRATPRARELFGLASGDVGRPLVDLGGPLTHLNLEAARALKCAQSIEREVESDDGRAFLLRAAPVRTPAGEVEGVALTFVDITTRKFAEEQRLALDALRQSDARFRAIVDQATAGVAEYGIKGEHLFANGTYRELLGYSQDELRALNLDDLVHPDDREHCDALFQQSVARPGPFTTQKRVIAKSGAILWVQESISSIRDAQGNAQSVVGVAIDVTASRAAEEVLRASEERLRAVFEQATAGIALIELDGRLAQVNDHFTTLLGFSTAELLGVRIQELTHPDDRPLLVEHFLALVNQGTSFELEKRSLRKNHGFLWVSASVSVVRGADGAPQLACAVVVDISERKRAQEEISQANHDLEARVAARTAELAAALEIVREEVAQRQQAEVGRDRLLGRIVGAQEEERRRLSRELHDNMGQHLTAILLAISALEAQQTAHSASLPFTDRRQKTDLRRLRAMVDELLSVSHHLAWEIRPALLDNVGLRAALEQYVANWGQISGIHADFVARGGMEKIALSPEDETALFRVTQEALTNVARHAGASQVSLVLEENEAGVAVIIEDNGRGIDLETSDTSTRLGLLGMKERMELVGGTLTLESGEGTGLTVYARVSRR